MNVDTTVCVGGEAVKLSLLVSLRTIQQMERNALLLFEEFL
jgi:hypothetical protein